MNKQHLEVKRRDGDEYEQIVFAEVLIPKTPNVFGDYWTEEAIKEAAYAFAEKGYGIDIDHDNVDISGSVFVAEWFIARENDPDFIKGSWVIGMKITDPVIWQQVLDNELNGFSYEAQVSFLEAVYTDDDDGVRQGYTEPSTVDGHVHAYAILVDANGRPVSGGTDEVNGHSHTISSHTVTDEADGHTHRFNIVNKEQV